MCNAYFKQKTFKYPFQFWYLFRVVGFILNICKLFSSPTESIKFWFWKVSVTNLSFSFVCFMHIFKILKYFTLFDAKHGPDSWKTETLAGTPVTKALFERSMEVVTYRPLEILWQTVSQTIQWTNRRGHREVTIRIKK